MNSHRYRTQLNKSTPNKNNPNNKNTLAQPSMSINWGITGSITSSAKAFTMLELIFVIVVIAIIAAVSIPRLAATKDDALSVAVKNDVANTITSVVATYNAVNNFGDISQAILLDGTRWTKSPNLNKTPNLAYVFNTKDNNKECVRMQVDDSNASMSFQVLIVANSQDIKGNDSRVCAKLRKMYSKYNGSSDNVLGSPVSRSIMSYIPIIDMALESEGIAW